MKQGNILRELFWALKTKHLAPGMNLFEYFCWRICRTRKLPMDMVETRVAQMKAPAVHFKGSGWASKEK